MPSLREVLAALYFLPIVIYWILVLKLSKYRKDGRGFGLMLLGPSYRLVRPELYTDEGQPLRRWARAVLWVMIPWYVLVGLLLI